MNKKQIIKALMHIADNLNNRTEEDYPLKSACNDLEITLGFLKDLETQLRPIHETLRGENNNKKAVKCPKCQSDRVEIQEHPDPENDIYNYHCHDCNHSGSSEE